MDIKAKITEIVNKVSNDKDFRKKFTADPIKAVEEIIGVDLPEEQIKKIADGVKAKISVDDLGNKIGSILGGFGKK